MTRTITNPADNSSRVSSVIRNELQLLENEIAEGADPGHTHSIYAPKASPTFTGTVTLPVGLTGVVRADSGVVSVDTDITDIVTAASETAAGKVELATDAETITGTDTARAVTPANLQAKVASDTAKGIVELATDAEVVTGSDTARAVTPAGLHNKTASEAARGVVELATAAETTTGTDATRAVSPDGLAGSTIFGRKAVSIQVYDGATDTATGDGKAYFTIPESLNGMNLVRAQATVVTAGTTNATTVMIHNKTDAVDMLSGAISIASAGTVGTVGTVNASNDDVATNDVIRIDIDSVSTTAAKGLMVVLEFQLP